MLQNFTAFISVYLPVCVNEWSSVHIWCTYEDLRTTSGSQFSPSSI